MTGLRFQWQPGVRRLLTADEIDQVCARSTLRRDEVACIELLDGQLTARMVGVLDKVRVTVSLADEVSK